MVVVLGRRIFPISRNDSLTAVFYQRYASILFSYICHRVPSHEDAEDLLLEVFLAALKYEKMLAWKGEDAQRAWLWTVARNKIKDFHKRASRRYTFVLFEEVTQFADDEKSLPEAMIVQQESHRDLHTHLKKLPPGQQEVLQLRFTGGLNCVEIASILKKRAGAVRTTLSRALNTLSRMYQRGEKD